jgi:ribosomal protein S18 acetylase RimI-like enzyme
VASSDLDNPIWHSLQGMHRALAQGADGVARYPAQVAPFLAAQYPDSDVDRALSELVVAGETVYLLGQIPRAGSGWTLKAYPELAQMVCDRAIGPTQGPAAIELDHAHRADVLDLTALVYPHYFRPRTMDMGRYFGIYDGARLAAMIGERMGTDTCREISAVCTHPDYAGRGYARHLLAWLTNDILQQGRIPFLHVSHENQRAKTLYLQMGYRLRRDIGFWSLRRA